MALKCQWAVFYMELASALLKYKNNRTELLSILKTIYADAGMNFPFKEKGQMYEDVCPFTVFGSFNKRITTVNRISLLEQFAKQFSEDTFDSDARSEIVSYLESDDSTRNNSFLDVNSAVPAQNPWGTDSSRTHEQTFTLIRVDGDTMTFSTYMFRYDGRSDRMITAPYLYDSLILRRGDAARAGIDLVNRSAESAFYGDFRPRIDVGAGDDARC